MADRVNQLQGRVATTRRADLSDKLVTLLNSVGDELNVYFDVVSGGQDASTGYTGSTRHDHGGASDVKAYTLNTDGSKKYLDFNNAADKKVWKEIARLSVANGATGIGAAEGYMGTDKMHIGFQGENRTGPAAKRASSYQGAWGAGGRSATAPDWMREAYVEGKRTPPGSIPTVATLTDTARTPPAPQIRPASLSVPSQVPLPRPRPTAPALAVPPAMQMFASGKPTDQQVADMYGGIGLTPRTPSLPPARPENFQPTNTRDEQAAMRRSPAPAAPDMWFTSKPPTGFSPPPSGPFDPKTNKQATLEASAALADRNRLNGYRAIQEMGPATTPLTERKAPKPSAVPIRAPAPVPTPTVQPTYQPGMTGRGLPVTTAPVPMQRPVAQSAQAVPLPRPRPLPTVPVPRISAPAAIPLSNFNTVNPMSQIAPRVGAYFNTTGAGHVMQALTGQPIQGGLLGGLFSLFGNRQQNAPAPVAPRAPEQPGFNGTTQVTSDQLAGGNGSIFTTGTVLPDSMNNKRWLTGY